MTTRRRLFGDLVPACILVTVAFVPSALAADPAAEALIKAGHWKRARAAVERSCPAEPNDADCSYLQSQVKEAFGNLDSALPLAEWAVQLDGARASYHYELAVICGETAEKASLFSKAGWAKRFRTEAERAAELDHTDLDSRFGLLEFYLQAPRVMGGGKDKAIAMAQEIAKIDPAQGFLAQARLAQDAKDAANEEASHLKAIAAGPANYEALVALAKFYASDSQKKYDLAERYARQAVRIDATQVEAYSVIATVYPPQGRFNDMDAVLAEAEKNVPDDFNPYYQAGRVLLVSGGDPVRAERYFRKYLTQEPEAGAPTLAHAHWRLGLALEKQGRKADAVSELQTALRLKPDLPEAKKDLKRLK